MTTLTPKANIHTSNSNYGISRSTSFSTDVRQMHCPRKCRAARINRQRWISQTMSGARVLAAAPNSVDQVENQLEEPSKIEGFERKHSYLFRTEIGGQVKISVGSKTTKYAVCIEVSFLPEWANVDTLELCWGMFRSDSSQFLSTMNPESFFVGDDQFPKTVGLEYVNMPFIQKALGRQTLELEFDSTQAPFYLSFLLFSSTDDGATVSEIRTHMKTKFVVPVGISPGYPMPLGVSFSDDGSVNFSVFSKNAESVILCLFDDSTDEPALEIDLDPYVNRTGNIWHVSMESLGKYMYYGYRCKGSIMWNKGSRVHMRHVLLDPYATILGAFNPDKGECMSLAKCIGRLCNEPPFDWSGDVHPNLPMEKLSIYRLNVGRFTEDKSSKLPRNIAGTFSGLVEKLDHFKSLGMNAILLEPIFPFDEQKGPYFPYHFFSPMNIYGSTYDGAHDGASAINSLKEMIKMLHANGIEVLLEVVFTHTAEGGDAACQMITFRGIDNSSYYIVKGDSGSGANNALNCNNPTVQQMILDSLRFWVNEFHIDGFCFINASSLTRGSNGEYLARPPLVERIAFDPLLSKTKIIADCWSPIDMSWAEIQFPHWKRWAEMNSRFCDDVRNFLKGEGSLSNLATRLCGSGDKFSDSRGPALSINFVAKNFGLSLVDLVSFSNDKLSSHLSWNCGEEGPTSNENILETRLKQMRNFIFILYISLGVPILNMGDECAMSTGGSPSYDNRKSFNWDVLRTGFSSQMTQFISFLNSFRRRRSDLLQSKDFLKVENIDWHASDLSQPKWNEQSCKFLAVTLKSGKCDSEIRERKWAVKF
ncbi:hypothetical protein QJS04_geneDACA003417 [Acorus gramineus]|uniref:Glycosyl hydrolase family 13 catalytic domain-containing protein n=1 Tax=Acorus gramineus TaxID=55184 RepID=A0AAV9BL56_ACOGR|nr:hypothetical protein QJS04_geneDACA003417 [Acorus gramineus]